MNKVLLTGATGFIGRHCTKYLADAGFEVHGVWHRAEPEGMGAVRWHRADLLDVKDVEKLCNEVGATHLLHLAWYAEPGKYRTGKQNLDWVIGSLNLLKGFAGNGGRRAVFAGTCFEYDSAYGYCSERLTPTVPDTFYGECKHGLSNIVAGFARQFGLSTAWGRIFFLYGPYEPAAKLVASVIRNLLLNRAAQCSRGLALRDYLHVEDVAGALVALLRSEVCGPVNVGSGQPVTLREIILTIANYAGNGANVEFGAVRSPENEPPLLMADVRRLEREVQWRPEYSLQTGIEQAVNWWRTELSATGEQRGATELKEQAWQGTRPSS